MQSLDIFINFIYIGIILLVVGLKIKFSEEITTWFKTKILPFIENKFITKEKKNKASNIKFDGLISTYSNTWKNNFSTENIQQIIIGGVGLLIAVGVGMVIVGGVLNAVQNIDSPIVAEDINTTSVGSNITEVLDINAIIPLFAILAVVIVIIISFGLLSSTY